MSTPNVLQSFSVRFSSPSWRFFPARSSSGSSFTRSHGSALYASTNAWMEFRMAMRCPTNFRAHSPPPSTWPAFSPIFSMSSIVRCGRARPSTPWAMAACLISFAFSSASSLSTSSFTLLRCLNAMQAKSSPTFSSLHESSPSLYGSSSARRGSVPEWSTALDGPATGASGTASPVAMLDTTASMRWTCCRLCLSRSTSSCASLRWRSSSFSMDAWSCSCRCSCVASFSCTWSMTSSSSRRGGGLFAGDADADRDRLSS
mmetsp:Transcript_20965/g.59261  ORF Transcript_20965/g.59261 Transcript_20965/m.59261 type:complete len:259 (+) Transcript_20965:1556-2332(+)